MARCGLLCLEVQHAIDPDEKVGKFFPVGYLPLDQKLEYLDFGRDVIPQNLISFSGVANSSDAWPHGGSSMYPKR